MAKRRKNRKTRNKNKNRKNVPKHPPITIDKTLEPIPMNEEIMQNIPSPGNIQIDTQITPTPNIQAHSQKTLTPNIIVTEHISPITTTPVNHRRSLHRKITLNNTLNVTNLNLLFDSNFVYNNTSDMICNKNLTNEKQINSRHLSTNFKETPRLIAKEIPQSNTIDQIIETPKISKVYLTEELTSNHVMEKSYDCLLNNKKLKNNVSGSNKMNKFGSNEVNVNPYLNRELKVHNKDGSDGEISFFTPQLFSLKSSSTPIDKMQSNHIVNYLKDSLKKDTTPMELEFGPNINEYSFSLGKIDVVANIISPKTPSPKNNVSKASSRVKSFYNHRKSIVMSPKSRHSPKVCNKNFTYSKLSVSKRTIDEIAELNKTGVCNRFFNRLKRYSKISAKYSAKAVDICARLGISLKNSISTMCNIYTDRSMLEASASLSNKCKCDEYKEEIASLNTKIAELSDELVTVKTQIVENKDMKTNLASLTESLGKVRQELNQITELRSELESLKEQFNCFKSNPQVVVSAPCVPSPPSPPPCAPPPPPPPPPPPMTLMDSIKPFFKRSKKSKSAESADSKTPDSRPVISLDDILKVKLKKTSERPASSSLRRNTQPVVSMDILRQVKLKPACRPQLRSETPTISETDSSSLLTTSPCTSLSRLLNENSSWKVKRLKKVSSLSFGSVHRKNFGRRERDRESS